MNLSIPEKGINWVTDSQVKKKKKKSEDIPVEILESPEIKLDVADLITKCDNLIESANTHYNINSNKELSDAIVMMHSVKRSLSLISEN